MSLVDLKGKALGSLAPTRGAELLTAKEAQRSPRMREMPQDFNPKFFNDADFVTYDDGNVRLGFRKPDSPELYLKLVVALRIAVWETLEQNRIRKLQ